MERVLVCMLERAGLLEQDLHWTKTIPNHVHTETETSFRLANTELLHDLWFRRSVDR